MTYTFVDPRPSGRMGWDDQAQLIALDNPLSQERSVLRPSLVPGLLEVLANNAARQVTDVRVFEVGQVFAPHRDEDGDRPAHEELWLAIALTGARQDRAWHASRDRVDVHDAKGMAELALRTAGAPAWDVAVPASGDPAAASAALAGTGTGTPAAPPAPPAAQAP